MIAQVRRSLAISTVGAAVIVLIGVFPSSGELQEGPGVIVTIAGDGTLAYGGDGGAATSAQIMHPSRVALDGAGNVFITDTGGHAIRKVNSSGVITTVSGDGVPGFRGDGGPASKARFNRPYDLSFGPDGSLYIADALNNRVRRIDTKGVISTFAGNGNSGDSGDHGPATKASVGAPHGIATDAEGNVYVVGVPVQGTYGSSIRKVDTKGVITTLAQYPASDIEVDGEKNVFIASGNVSLLDRSGNIGTFAGGGNAGGDLRNCSGAGDGGLATDAALCQAKGVAVGKSGQVFIADSDGHRVRMVSSNGVISTVAGSGGGGFGGDGGSAAKASLRFPTGVAVDPQGNLYIADTANNRVRLVRGPFPSGSPTPARSPAPKVSKRPASSPRALVAERQSPNFASQLLIAVMSFIAGASIATLFIWIRRSSKESRT